MPKKASKKAKLLSNLRNFSVPYKYRDIVWVLNHIGFEEEPSSGGSPRTFTRGSVILTFHEPHGDGERTITKKARQEVIKAIDRAIAEAEAEE